MTLFPLLLCTAALAPDGGEGFGAVSIDGGEVPIVAPTLTPAVASVLAPELVADAGQTLDGNAAPTVVPETLSVYTVDVPAEAAITAVSFGVYFVVDILVKPTLQGDISCRSSALGNNRCNPADLSSFDRYAVGKSSVPWRDFSDVALFTSMFLPAVYLGLESLALPTKHPVGDFATDLLVITESLALTASMQTILKFAFRRPRPSRYLPVDPQITSAFDAELSLPSGHVSLVAAATTALTTTIFMRHPESKVRFVALGAGVVLSCLTAVARVESGYHFPTDVITGLVLGAFAGFVVPYLHRKGARLTPSVAFNPVTATTMFALSGAL